MKKPYYYLLFLISSCFYLNVSIGQTIVQESKDLLYQHNESFSLETTSFEKQIIPNKSYTLNSLHLELPAKTKEVKVDYADSEPKVLLFTKPQDKEEYGGRIVTYYNLASNNTLWSYRSYMRDVTFLKNFILFSNGKVVIAIEKTSGKQLWTKLGVINNIYSDLNLCQLSIDGTNYLFDLKTGNTIGKFSGSNVKISQDYLEGKTQYHQDLNRLFAFNKSEGVLWDVKSQTTKTNTGKVLTRAAAVGVAATLTYGTLSLIMGTGSYYIPTYYSYQPGYTSTTISLGNMQTGNAMSPNVLYGLHSNILTGHDNSIFVADKKKISKLSTLTGSVIWESRLPTSKNGNSYLFFDKAQLMMFCTGKALTPQGFRSHGKSFIYQFNAKNGDSIAHKDLSKDYIIEQKLSPGKYTYITKNSYTEYNNYIDSTRAFDYSKDVRSKKTIGKITDIIDTETDSIFVYVKGKYETVDKYVDTAKTFSMLTTKGLLILDPETLEKKRFIPIAALGLLQQTIGQVSFIRTFTVRENKNTFPTLGLTAIDTETGNIIGTVTEGFPLNYERLNNNIFVSSKFNKNSIELINCHFKSK